MTKFKTIGLLTSTILIMTILQTACERPISQPKPHPLSDSPTHSLIIGTITKTPTITPSQGLKTPIPTITTTSTFQPFPEGLQDTPDPQPTPTLQVSLPNLPGNESSTILIDASPEILIKLQLSRTGQFLYSNTQLDELLYPAIHEVIDFEWRRSYTHTNFSSDWFSLIPNFFDHSNGRLTNSMLTDLVGDYVIDQLNQDKWDLANKSSYTLPYFSGRVYAVEIDGDKTSEWLVEITNEDGFYLGENSFWITLDQNEKGNYRRLQNQIPWIYGKSYLDNPKGRVEDINGDGIVDIAILEESSALGDSNSRIHIARGGPDGFSLLQTSLNQDPLISPGSYNTIYQWGLSPDNGLPVLKITTIQLLNPWPCEISTQKEYQWVGNLERVTGYQTIIPETPICALAQAFSQDKAIEPAARISFLKATVHHPDGLSPEYQVYALYQMALLSSLAHEDGETRDYLNLLNSQSNPPSHPIASNLMERIRPLLQDDIIGAYQLCLAAESISGGISIIPGSTSYPYVGYQEGYPLPLCDSREIITDVLNAIRFEPNLSPESQLQSAGLPVVLLQKIGVENSVNWLAVIQSKTPYISLDQTRAGKASNGAELLFFWFTPDQGGNLINTLSGVNFLESILINHLDLTGDGIIDFALAFPTQNPGWANCDETDIPIDLYLITSLKGNWLVSFTYTLCLPEKETLDFTLVLQDQNNDGIVDLVANDFEQNLFDLTLLPDLPPDQPIQIYKPWYWGLYQQVNIDYLLNDLTLRTLSTPASSGIQSEIFYYLNQWGSFKLFSTDIRAHLNYLLALRYEFVGDHPKAIHYYYDIWKNQPDTIWAYLASSRLSPRNK